METYTLNNMEEGSGAKIKELLLSGGIRRRLRDIGLIEGASVTCLHKGYGGDPIAYLIRGAVIALRGDDASKIIVESVLEKGE